MHLHVSPWRSPQPFCLWVQAVVELLEGLTCNLFSKSVLELETWVAIQDVFLRVLTSQNTCSWRRCHVVELETCFNPKS